MPRKKGRQPLTIIVVPHSERAPISFRFPNWLLPLISSLSLALLACFGILLVRSHRLSAELQELQQEKQIQLTRETEMRDTILAQQDEVQDLSQQVEDFGTEWAGIRALSADIQSLIGIPTPTDSPMATPVAYSDSPSEDTVQAEGPVALDAGAKGGGTQYSVAQPDMLLAVEKSQDLVQMQVTLPRALRALVELREQVLARVERIEPEKRSDPAELEQQLRLLAAAPHFWPTASRRISSKFGYRTLEGKFEFHKGIDIMVGPGTEIMATREGIVTKAGWRATYGWTVELEHEMGFTTIYGHNSQLFVQAGDRVEAGDVIALSGNSGRSTGPHLHYEIRLNDTAADPMKYLGLDDPNVLETE
jgi:murein DD-endopeptidase MepM/ murein hydrolase activator NlpD